MKKVVYTLVFLLVVAVAGTVACLYSGIYNVAATSPHSALFHEAVEILVERSVERRAAEVQVPDDFKDISLRTGFEHYDQMCVGCHGAPGVEAIEITGQMNPEPPDLAEEAGEWLPAELYWIIVHGLKMTGMPGIEKIHDQREAWQITAFVRRLPNLSASAYRELRAQARDDAGHEGHEH